MKKIIISENKSKILNITLTIVASYLLYNYTIAGIIFATVYILLLGLLNIVFKTNVVVMNCMSIGYALSVLIYIITKDNLLEKEIINILIINMLFAIYFVFTESFVEIEK